MLPTLQLPLAPVDWQSSFVLADMLCESRNGMKIDFKDVPPSEVPAGYHKLGEDSWGDVRGKSFPATGSSIIVHCLLF